MAIAETPTLLPLDTFFKIIGFNPLHVNMVDIPDVAPTTCASIITQYDWQGADKVGRESIAEAIADAELSIIQECKFSPGPAWENQEFYRIVTPSNPALVSGWGQDPKGFWQSIKLMKGYFLESGAEQRDLIQSGAVVVYSDNDGDTYPETATVTVAVGTSVAANEVEAFYPGYGSRLGVDNGYAIRPIRVTIAAGVATIVFRREQAVDLDLLTQLGNQVSGVDGMNTSNFLATVDVYRHWTNPATQVNWLWEQGGPVPWGFSGPPFCSSCGGTGCPACGFDSQPGCMKVVDMRLGLVRAQPAAQNADGSWSTRNWADGRQADAVQLWYRHGLIDQYTGQMPRDWERAIAYLAASRLDRPLCNCNTLEDASKYWGENYTLINEGGGGGGGRYQLSNRTTDNPLGGTRAAEYVWRLIQRHKIGEGSINA